MSHSWAVCERHFRRQCHRDLLVHDGPGHWVVEGADHGVPEQAGAIEQHTGELMKPFFEDYINFGSCYRFDNVLGCLHHLPK